MLCSLKDEAEKRTNKSETSDAEVKAETGKDATLIEPGVRCMTACVNLKEVSYRFDFALHILERFDPDDNIEWKTIQGDVIFFRKFQWKSIGYANF